jgi:hypothetical protein
MRCLVLSGPEPIEHQFGHLTVDALAGIPASALLIEPRIEIGSGLAIALDGECVIAGPKRPPHLMSTEDRDEIDRYLRAQVPSSLAPHQAGVTCHVHDPPGVAPEG